MNCLLPPLVLDSLNRCFNIFLITECRESEITFAGVAEAAAGCADHVTLVEQFVEEIPTGYPIRGLEPDVGCVHATIAGDPGGSETFPDDTGICHVIVDRFPDLRPAFV